MAYKEDYENSVKIEREFEQFIKTKYNLLTENSQGKGDFKDWDISTTASTKHHSKVTTFEVKYNRNYHSGNAVIEMYRQQYIVHDGFWTKEIIPTGLSATKADYYVFKFQNEEKYWLITVPKLKELLTENNPKVTFIFDRNDYRLAIVAKSYLQENCKCVLIPNTPTPPLTSPNQFNQYN